MKITWKKWLCLLFLFPLILGAKSYPRFNLEELIPEDPKISETDWLVLKKGETLLRENQDGLLGGMAIIHIPSASPAQIWEIVTDYENYAEFMPTAKEVNTKDVIENGEIVLGIYKSTWPLQDIHILSVNLYDKKNPEHMRMVWKATETNLKEAYGFWILKAHEEGTLVFYRQGFDLNWIPRPLARSMGEKRVIEIVTAVKKRAKTHPSPK